MERFSEGVKKAASRARELGDAQKNRNWYKVAFMLEKLLANGTAMFNGKSISRQDALGIIGRREAAMEKDING
jgi:hypothetical protein